MARYKVSLGGLTIEMDNPEDVRDLAFVGNTLPSPPTGAYRRTPKRTLISHGRVIGRPALEFLKTLHGVKAGMSSEVLGKRLKVRTLGRMMHSLNRALKGSGIDPKDVVQKSAANGTTLWFPGEKLDKAINTLEKMITEAQPESREDQSTA